jgi:DNA-binding IclR family transcriptional regulator
MAPTSSICSSSGAAPAGAHHDVGVRLPAHQTATGRSLLACLPATQLRALYVEDPVYRRSAPVPGPAAPAARLGGHQGGLRRRERRGQRRFASVAVAIRDRNGWPAGSLAVTFPHVGIKEELPDLAHRSSRFASELGRLPAAPPFAVAALRLTAGGRRCDARGA